MPSTKPFQKRAFKIDIAGDHDREIANIALAWPSTEIEKYKHWRCSLQAMHVLHICYRWSSERLRKYALKKGSIFSVSEIRYTLNEENSKPKSALDLLFHEGDGITISCSSESISLREANATKTLI